MLWEGNGVPGRTMSMLNTLHRPVETYLIYLRPLSPTFSGHYHQSQTSNSQESSRRRTLVGLASLTSQHSLYIPALLSRLQHALA